MISLLSLKKMLYFSNQQMNWLLKLNSNFYMVVFKESINNVFFLIIDIWWSLMIKLLNISKKFKMSLFIMANQLSLLIIIQYNSIRWRNSNGNVNLQISFLLITLILVLYLNLLSCIFIAASYFYQKISRFKKSSN